MVKKYLLPVVFLFISIFDGLGQNEKRTTCVTPDVTISADYCTNPGEVILTASPSSGVTYLWSTGQTTQSITVDVVGTYSVTATTVSGGCAASSQMDVGQELVTNGDFTAGNTGFTSGYAYKADSAGYNMELYDDSGNNAYGVGTDGQNYHPSFYGRDHTNNTSGARNFMLVNGHGNIVVWEETVSVQPNTNYYYSAWAMNLNPSSPAQLQFEVNGVKIGTIADLNYAPKPSKNSQVNLNNWVRFYYGSSSGWNSGSATTAVIRIIDLNSDLSGNDFGLDDISFATLSPFLTGPGVAGTDNQEICPGSAIQTIAYKVGSGGAPSVTGLPAGVSSSFDGLNLSITGTPTTPGTYNYEVSTTGCAVPITATGTIVVKNPGIWTGAVSTDWNNGANWICGIVPGSTTEVEIGSGLTNYPILTDTASGYCDDLSIAAGASLTVRNGGFLQISGAISSTGTFDATDGTIEMSGSGAQAISGGVFYQRTLKNLVVSNTNASGLSISAVAGDTLNIAGNLSFGSASAKLNTGDNLTLLSNQAATAYVGKLGPGNSITGKVLVERFINIGTSAGQHAKSWQFLSTPTSGQTVKESWMENGGTPAGYGTQVTGPGGVAAGFDLYSGTPSLKYYNSFTNSWTGISSTQNQLYNPGGYLVFVRGDRSVTAFGQPPTVTTLRSQGTLLTGTLSPVQVNAGAFTSIGNPYASAIDFTSITKDAGIDDEFYVWDPYLAGSYGLGGYQTLSSTNGWEPVPGQTTAYPAGVPETTIQSGQAFMVYAPGVASFVQQNYSLTFSEDCKINASPPVNFARNIRKETSDRQYFRASLYTGPAADAPIADGNAVVFSAGFSNKVDRNDAIKLSNDGENFGVELNDTLLAVEARAPIAPPDSICYFLNHLRRGPYQFRFCPKDMHSPGVQAFLEDNYLKTETPVSLSDTTFVDFAITPDAASADARRFKIVFRKLDALPLTFISLEAHSEQGDVLLTWKVDNESAMAHYEVETSNTGEHFNKVHTVVAANSGASVYQWIDSGVDPGPHYYRIKSVGKSGWINYSRVVKVLVEGVTPSITVYPNPVTDGTVHLRLTNQPPGKYGFRLLNNFGQAVCSMTSYHQEGTGSQDIHWNYHLSHGEYQLQVIMPTGEVKNLKVFY